MPRQFRARFSFNYVIRDQLTSDKRQRAAIAAFAKAHGYFIITEFLGLAWKIPCSSYASCEIHARYTPVTRGVARGDRLAQAIH
jgi:hypothetical protein